jgi:transcriptional regulator with XRE-family HTH domain
MKTGPQPNRLRVLRAERKVSQHVVSDRTGINVTRFWYLETGRRAPRVDEVRKLAEFFGVPQRDLGFAEVDRVSA